MAMEKPWHVMLNSGEDRLDARVIAIGDGYDLILRLIRIHAREVYSKRFVSMELWEKARSRTTTLFELISSIRDITPTMPVATPLRSATIIWADLSRRDEFMLVLELPFMQNATQLLQHDGMKKDRERLDAMDAKIKQLEERLALVEVHSVMPKDCSPPRET
jgi:hypothetical protein